MSALTSDARKALTSGRLAHRVTINADGSPQASIVWVGVEDDEIVCAHLGQGRKLANIERDPRILLSMEADGRNDVGLDHYLVVHGTARITTGGGPELLQHLAAVYLGPGLKFPPFDNPPPGHVIRISAERLAGVGPLGNDHYLRRSSLCVLASTTSASTSQMLCTRSRRRWPPRRGSPRTSGCQGSP